MPKRRVQLVGGTTLAISLPKEWSRLTGVGKGDEVEIEVLPDLSLRIVPAKLRPVSRPDSIEISMDAPGELEAMSVISAYLLSYDEITIRCRACGERELREFANEVCEKTIGLELMHVREGEAHLKFVVGEGNIDIPEILERNLAVLSNLLSEARDVFEGRKDPREALEDARELDRHVDRFTLYGARLANSVMVGKVRASSVGVAHMLEASIYGHMLRSAERAVDHVVRLLEDHAERPSTLGEGSRSHVRQHIEVLAELCDLTRRALGALTRESVSSALEAAARARKFEAAYRELIPRDPALYYVLDNLARIRGLLHDVLEHLVDVITTRSQAWGRTP